MKTSTIVQPSVVLMTASGIICTLVSVAFARLAYGLVIPPMRAELQMSYADAASLGTVTALGYLTVLLYAGVFATRYGAKKAILLGMGFAFTGFAGMGLSSSFVLQILFMAFLGLGTAFTFTPLVSLLGNWYPERRGTVIGFSNSGVGLGILLSGALVPALTEADPVNGWRHVWLVFAACAALTALVVMRGLQDPPRKSPGGSARLGMLQVCRSPHVLTIGLVYGIVGITYIVHNLFMYSFAVAEGVGAVSAGRMVALMGLISVISGPSWGWAADRIGHANVLMICSALAMLANFLPVLSPQLVTFALHYILIGLSVSGMFTSILASATTTVTPQLAAVAVSFVTLFFALGQLIGPAFAGMLIEWQQDFRLSFLLCGLLLFVGVLLSYHSRRYITPRPD